jgi:cyclic pyranopterin phosphate synthase
VKLNCVVAEGKNIEDILPFVEFTRNRNVSVRFLEEMPFNGSESFIHSWSHKRIYSHIRSYYPQIEPVENEANSTSTNYKIPGFKGIFGIIPSFSRTFCGTCNRIRLSATGELRTCLYGPAAINLRDVMRAGASDSEIEVAIINAVAGRVKDGFEAEGLISNSAKESMSVLGG